MPKIVLENVTKVWGGFYAVDHLNMTIEDNGFVTLLGPSGCGKTTTLRMIAGLETPTTGKITINDEVVFDSDKGINVPANKRHVGFLFQNYALWPHMTVYKNITFGLNNIKVLLPVVSSMYNRYLAQSKAVLEVEKLVDFANSSRDKKGKIVAKKAILSIVDEFKISWPAATELFKLHFEEMDIAQAKELAGTKSQEYINKAEAEKQKFTAKGLDINDKGQVMKDGEVLQQKRKLDKEEVDLRVRHVARVVKIGEFMDRYPSELSGGQQQRVAIARTLAPGPKVLFMDEPLSNLDAKLRLEMRSELKRLHVETGSTFVYVTHDQLEAMTLATKICLINNGVLQQYEAPLDVYSKPNNLFVADFVGNPAINFVLARATQKTDKSIEISLLDNEEAFFECDTNVSLADIKKEREKEEKEKALLKEENAKNKKFIEKENADKSFNFHISTVDGTLDSKDEENIPENEVVLGIRPEFLHITKTGPIEGEIYSALPSGMETTVKIKVGKYLLTSVVFGGVDYKVGTKVHLSFANDEILLFDRISGKRIAQGSVRFKKTK